MNFFANSSQLDSTPANTSSFQAHTQQLPEHSEAVTTSEDSDDLIYITTKKVKPNRETQNFQPIIQGRTDSSSQMESNENHIKPKRNSQRRRQASQQSQESDHLRNQQATASIRSLDSVTATNNILERRLQSNQLTEPQTKITGSRVLQTVCTDDNSSLYWHLLTTLPEEQRCTERNILNDYLKAENEKFKDFLEMIRVKLAAISKK